MPAESTTEVEQGSCSGHPQSSTHGTVLLPQQLPDPPNLALTPPLQVTIRCKGCKGYKECKGWKGCRIKPTVWATFGSLYLKCFLKFLIRLFFSRYNILQIWNCYLICLRLEGVMLSYSFYRIRPYRECVYDLEWGLSGFQFVVKAQNNLSTGKRPAILVYLPFFHFNFCYAILVFTISVTSDFVQK